MFFGLVVRRVRGQSMACTLSHGDVLIGQRLPDDRSVRAGDVVEIKHRDLGRLVKRVVDYSNDGYWVSGDSTASLEAKRIGLITRDQILAKFFLKLSPRGISRIPKQN